MEYTDAPAIEKSAQTFAAPTAATGLLETAEGQASDMVAVMLSIVPGLGHIYKGYRLIGLFLIFFGTPVAFGLALLIATATAGFGFFLLPIYWIAVMVNVWAIPDRVVTASGRRRRAGPDSLGALLRGRDWANAHFVILSRARNAAREGEAGLSNGEGSHKQRSTLFLPPSFKTLVRSLSVLRRIGMTMFGRGPPSHRSEPQRRECRGRLSPQLPRESPREFPATRSESSTPGNARGTCARH